MHRLFLSFCCLLGPISLINSEQELASNTEALSKAQRIASYTYERQKVERKRRAGLSTSLAVFGANWPCMWGEEVTGYIQESGGHEKKFGDGWKFTCGLRRIQPPCVIYSMGSRGNLVFELSVLDANPSCIIHIFDKDNYDVMKSLPRNSRSKHKNAYKRAKNQIIFHNIFIGQFDNFSSVPPVHKIDTVMSQLGHTHLDVLKMDIEGTEWEVLNEPLPSIGQLQVELHLYGNRTVNMTDDQKVSYIRALFDNVERHGLRLFHREVNARFNTNCVELAFIQEYWTPGNKSYLPQ